MKHKISIIFNGVNLEMEIDGTLCFDEDDEETDENDQDSLPNIAYICFHSTQLQGLLKIGYILTFNDRDPIKLKEVSYFPLNLA